MSLPGEEWFHALRFQRGKIFCQPAQLLPANKEGWVSRFPLVQIIALDAQGTNGDNRPREKQHRQVCRIRRLNASTDLSVDRGTGGMSPPSVWKRAGVFCILALGGAGLDLWTKHWAFQRLGLPAQGPPWKLLPGILHLETSLNEGALFGLGDGFTWLFALLSVVALVGILWWLFAAQGWKDRWLVVALGLICAGVLGNLYDRLGLHRLRWHTVVLNPDGSVRHYPGDRVYAVRDWIHLHYQDKLDWPIFNLADTMLVVGVGMLLVHAYLLQPRQQGAGQKRLPSQQKPCRSASVADSDSRGPEDA